MILDSHLHLWINNPKKYPWDPIGGYIPEKEAPLSLFLEVFEQNGLDGAVFVQPTPYGWDNAYLLACKNTDPERFKAVVLVDPLSEQAAETMEMLAQEGANGLRVNLHLRPLNQWDDEGFFQLVQICQNLHLPICFQTTPEYYQFINDLASRTTTNLIIDHLGRPPSGCNPENEIFKELLGLSKNPNVYIKLSGMNYYSNEKAPYCDTWDLLKAVEERFCADHCLWGSDFPFVQEHWAYDQLLDLFRHNLDFSEDELAWIFGKTAKKLWWPESF